MSFELKMNRAKTMQRIDAEHSDYWAGYMRGLRRAHHGDRFGTEAEHQLWMTVTGDDSRNERSRGYRDGFNGAEPDA